MLMVFIAMIPKQIKTLKKFDYISYEDIVKLGLKVLDYTAATMASENNIDILIFNILENDSLLKIIDQKISHTIISNKK